MTSNKDIILYKETSYNYNFIGGNNLKEIYNEWDLFIDWSENIGNSHYAFTINYPSDENHKKSFYCNTYKNLLGLHPIGKNESIIHDGDTYINFDSLEDDFKGDPSFWDNIQYIFDPYKGDILTTWIFTIVEENREGYVHLHGIVAVKNIIDYNKNIKHNILSKFKESYSLSDVVIKNLNNFKDIKGWIRYLHENNRWVFKPSFSITANYLDIIEKRFLKAYLNNYNLKNTKKEISNYKYDYRNVFCSIHTFDCKNLNKKIFHFIGVKLNRNELSQEVFIDLVSNYMLLNDLWINKDNIYKKIKDSLISYKNIGFVEDILFNKFQNTVMTFFLENFPLHFKNFDFYFLVKNFKNKMQSDILKIKNTSNNIIEFDFSLMEFNDGVYNIRNNNFIFRKDIGQLDLCTIKYYSKSYNWVRQNKPKEWIKGIRNALGEDNFDDFVILCLFIATIFQPTNENIKKNFLYIHGKSNTGKTTLLSKVIYRYFGESNVGTIVSDNNFKFQDINDKLFIILEEFRYKKSLSSDFLKLLGGEKLLTSKKYSKEHISIENIKGLIISNELINEKNDEIKKALENRLYIINFVNKVISSDSNINDIMLEEEAEIILFCNKLLFRLNYKKQNRFKGKNKFEKKYNNLNYLSKNKFGNYKFNFSEVIDKIHKSNLNKHIDDKYSLHFNGRFGIKEVKNNIIVKLDYFLDLTFTRNPREDAYYLGDLKDGKKQFLNKNHMLFGETDNTGNFFLNKKITNKNNATRSSLEDLILFNKDNLNKIEEDLSSTYFNTDIKNLNDTYEKCLELKSTTSDCMFLYNIRHVDNLNFIFEMFINK